MDGSSPEDFCADCSKLLGVMNAAPGGPDPHSWHVSDSSQNVIDCRVW